MLLIKTVNGSLTHLTPCVSEEPGNGKSELSDECWDVLKPRKPSTDTRATHYAYGRSYGHR